MSTQHILAAAALAGIFSGSAFAASSSKPVSAGTSIDVQADKGEHTCKGKNECKGKGGCGSSDNGCKGKNSCKGHGGCKSAPDKFSK